MLAVSLLSLVKRRDWTIKTLNLLGKRSNAIFLVPDNAHGLEGHKHARGLQLEDRAGVGRRMDSCLHVHDQRYRLVWKGCLRYGDVSVHRSHHFFLPWGHTARNVGRFKAFVYTKGK